MRKLFAQVMISLDGYYEGADKQLDWHNVDQEFENYSVQMLDSADTLLFGRITYQLMENFWTTEHAFKSDPLVAQRMNDMRKVVVSNTLNDVTWNNTTLIKENMVTEIKKLKQENGKKIALLASSNLALSLIGYDLIDEFHFLINPVLLGNGHSFLKGLHERIKLTLISSHVFDSGNVLLIFKPHKK